MNVIPTLQQLWPKEAYSCSTSFKKDKCSIIKFLNHIKIPFLISNTSLTKKRTKKASNPIKEEFKAKRTENKIKR